MFTFLMTYQILYTILTRHLSYSLHVGIMEVWAESDDIIVGNTWIQHHSNNYWLKFEDNNYQHIEPKE